VQQVRTSVSKVKLPCFWKTSDDHGMVGGLTRYGIVGTPTVDMLLGLVGEVYLNLKVTQIARHLT
jgi:hypothetical protein